MCTSWLPDAAHRHLSVTATACCKHAVLVPIPTHDVQGLLPFEGHDLATCETSTRGLDTLAAAAAGYRQGGARFAKWRAALRVDASRGFPSERAVELNAQQLAQYAAVCQAAGEAGKQGYIGVFMRPRCDSRLVN